MARTRLRDSVLSSAEQHQCPACGKYFPTDMRMRCHMRDKDDDPHHRLREGQEEQPTVKKSRTRGSPFGAEQMSIAAHGDATDDGAAATEGPQCKEGTMIGKIASLAGGFAGGFAKATQLFQSSQDGIAEPKSEIITSTARTSTSDPIAPPRDRTRVNHEHGRQMALTQESNATHQLLQMQKQLAKQREINEHLQQQLSDKIDQMNEMRAVSVCMHEFAHASC